ncbi:hypothetical protein FS837_001155 [Tulasnella sp. UAMH 9824]|nr:hypothetical protein FS837_001155 [Tulasnella sp. UAMH 9824]
MPYGPSSRDGAHGPGLYTYKNPALAHHVAISDDDHQTQATNHVLIQCRVVTRENSGPGSKSLAGSIDDSGATFCAQSTAIIPTHLLIYRLNASKDTQHLGGSVNVNLASIAPTISAATHASAGLGQPKSSTNTGPGEIKLKAAKGKGKARAKGPLQ